MNENEKVVTIDVEETETTTESMEEKKESKFVTGIKKYGKKIAGTAIIIAVGVIGYVLGKNSQAIEAEWHEVNDGSDDVYYPESTDDKSEEKEE